MWGLGKHQGANDASRSNEYTGRKTTSVVNRGILKGKKYQKVDPTTVSR